MTTLPSRFDHLILATPDLDAGIALVTRRLGVTPAMGGTHPAWGTRNALVPLGNDTYFEIIGPDPASSIRNPTLVGIDKLTEPKLVTWVAKGSHLERLGLGPVVPGQRLRPDGTTVRWELTDPFAERAGGVIPFFIDWKTDAHPGRTATPGLALTSVIGRHPDPATVLARLRSLALDLHVEPGPSPGLTAVFETPAGRITLS